MRLARPARCGGDAGGPGPAAAFAARPRDLWRTPRTGCRPGRSRPRGPPCIDAVPTAPRRALPPSSTGSTRAVLRGRSVAGGEATRALWIAEPCCSPRARAVSRARRLVRFCLRRVPREHDRTRPPRSPSPAPPSAWQTLSSVGRAAQAPMPPPVRTEHRALADRLDPRALASFPPVPLDRFEGGRGREWIGRALHRRHRMSRGRGDGSGRRTRRVR